MSYREFLAHEKPALKYLIQRIWRARRYPESRDKVTQMAVEFLVEASVLVGVLGILDFVITYRQQPTLKVVAWSLGIAVGLFAAAVIMQAVGESEPEEASLEAPASNRREEENANA